MQETLVNSWIGKIPWKRDRLPTPVFLGFPDGSDSKESTCNAGDLGSIPGLGRSPGEGKDQPLQYSGLENSMDCKVHGVDEQSDMTFYSSLLTSARSSYLSEGCQMVIIQFHYSFHICQLAFNYKEDLAFSFMHLFIILGHIRGFLLNTIC